MLDFRYSSSARNPNPKASTTMSYVHFTSIQRGEISAYLAAGYSKARIARQLGRDRSSLGREIKRNSVNGVYDPQRAQARYDERRKECRPARKLDYAPLRSYVFDRITDGWTPETIAGRLPLDFPEAPRMRISHEAIYQAIYGDERMHCLIKDLPQARPRRRKRGQGKTGRATALPNRVGIEHRPPEVDERKRHGDWEGDLIVGAAQSGYLLTLVERTTLNTMIRKLDTKNAEHTAEAAIDAFMDMPKSWIRTITFDNGTEFAAHETIARETGADIYFAAPYSSYQRGTNENTNGLIRRFLPKNTRFDNITQKQLNVIEDYLNNRPRKKLGYRTPNEVFYSQRKIQHVALRA
ncbi:MAG: IS30 family transposase [Candidatus Hydrogenedentes bacterium]|nr:IS30 family transposase [Candidatus Hydrogenedentota bacterium]